MDSADFTDYFHATYPGLLRYVTRMAGHSAAEEICAETMTTLWQKNLAKPDTVEGEKKLRGLAYRVAQGHARNRTRGDRRRLVLAARIRAQMTSFETVEGDIADAVLDAGDARRKLDVLRPADRDVIALIIDGFSFPDIAAILDCSPAAARTRAVRARSRMRDLISEEDHNAAHR